MQARRRAGVLLELRALRRHVDDGQRDLRAFSPRVAIYSIDESFFDVAADRRERLARDLPSTVLTWTGLPTCVGIGPTKTLTDERVRRRWMADVQLEEVWGIGPATQAKL